MDIGLVWEALSGAILVAGGVFLVIGSLVRPRPRWVPTFGAGDKVTRIANIVFAVLLCLGGALFLNVARHGDVVQRGGVIIHLSR